jgi:hypothetical protein
LQPGNQALGLVDGARFVELVGQGQNQNDQRLLVIWRNAQNILADAFSLSRLVEKSVTLGLGKGFRNGLRRNSFRFEHNVSSLRARR